MGRCKSWTLDSGLDHGLDRGLDGGLDFGPDFGPKFGPSFGLLVSSSQALSVYGLAMSSSKLEEEASAIVITSDDTWVTLIKFLLQKISQIRMLTKSGL